MNQWRFVKVLRDSVKNERVRDGKEAGRLVYDYRIDRDGVTVGWFRSHVYSRGYYLTDKTCVAVHSPETRIGRSKAIDVTRKDDFLATIKEYGALLPSDEQIEARRAESERRAAKHRAERSELTRQRVICENGPMLLDALKKIERACERTISAHARQVRMLAQHALTSVDASVATAIRRMNEHDE